MEESTIIEDTKFLYKTQMPQETSKIFCEWLDNLIQERDDWKKGYELLSKEKWQIEKALDKLCYDSRFRSRPECAYCDTEKMGIDCDGCAECIKRHYLESEKGNV